jgi:hypothetical protein
VLRRNKHAFLPERDSFSRQAGGGGKSAPAGEAHRQGVPRTRDVLELQSSLVVEMADITGDAFGALRWYLRRQLNAAASESAVACCPDWARELQVRILPGLLAVSDPSFALP